MSEVKVTASITESYNVDFESRTHSWNADEPFEDGGKDLGPKPTELLLSSLAGCKLITVRMYALRKEWDLQKVTIELKILEKGEKTLIEKKIRFEGNLDEDQKKRLLDISGRCPVAKMLSNSLEYKFV